ncbi:glycine--tRNA ligase [Candidatus Campbellbacteria bacterium CG10_big_fil_rev_8_21_14_0_10_35_52]|uniref:Glycine--tRNA ligase n=1 Tax=Candidatus Campbellbacteria bacterium CG10_big_fil_rev_8_21_14_0_10_35_52 TaxID=1974527 RepID=A0A2M6WVX8_9BACT|nr:MAG: glycine--tRNA ligase [Candidatus Campbellbacteria bacterium CG10_big_fil_rev_8_21_14_0_10_35_52]
MKKEENKLEKIVSLAKRRGFAYQGSEIYGGLSGMWDYGPFGVALKNNIKNLWWKTFVDERENIYGLDAAIIMNSKVLEASGHLKNFTETLVECDKCKKQFRADHIEGYKCPDCGGELEKEKQFNEMFETSIGASKDSSSVVYLRPETAQGIFTNFKNIIDSFHPRLPFGIAQIGKAFRNEINARDFLFRAREFEQMEIEFFINPPVNDEWKKYFEDWRKLILKWLNKIGFTKDIIYESEVSDKDRAHYSKKTIDFEYDFPFGRGELLGLAYRTDYDLKNHKLDYFDDKTGERFIPHVIEPSFGVDRMVFAVLSQAYTEDNLGDEVRTYLKLPANIAPIKAAFFPLLKNKIELVKKARKIFEMIKKEIPHILFDDNGNIGKRYRRQDEIGTPHCITIDFDTMQDGSVTLRDRDTGKQKRIKIEEIISYISV